MQFVRLLHTLQGNIQKTKPITGNFLVDDNQTFIVNDQNCYIEINNILDQTNNISP